MKTALPVGFHRFHKDKFFNFQMNRWYSLGYTRLEDLKKAAAEIRTVEDYPKVFLRLAEISITENRLKNAAFYYRAAEFLVNPFHPEKIPIYDKFIDLFYEAFKENNIERHKIPFENSFLSSLRLKYSGNTCKGTVVIHGGFDSLIEEWYCLYEFFAYNGYEVVAFEGPGQGGSLRKYGLTFNHDWEKPVKSVLDYFNLSDVTLIGISMGGYWCLRAAAFEKRIKRVISFPPLYDWMESTNSVNKILVKLMMKWEWLMNKSIRLKMKTPLMEHVINQTLFITGKKNPIDVVHWELAMNKHHIHSELVDQDVLLLAGEEDSFQPVELFFKQMKALTNARSVTGKIFTPEEQAEHHCAIGNFGWALQVMLQWLEHLKTQGRESKLC
jgi:pimeloyl-ACP methyl ester carboxylesterase